MLQVPGCLFLPAPEGEVERGPCRVRAKVAVSVLRRDLGAGRERFGDLQRGGVIPGRAVGAHGRDGGCESRSGERIAAGCQTVLCHRQRIKRCRSWIGKEHRQIRCGGHSGRIVQYGVQRFMHSMVAHVFGLHAQLIEKAMGHGAVPEDGVWQLLVENERANRGAICCWSRYTTRCKEAGSVEGRTRRRANNHVRRHERCRSVEGRYVEGVVQHAEPAADYGLRSRRRPCNTDARSEVQRIRIRFSEHDQSGHAQTRQGALLLQARRNRCILVTDAQFNVHTSVSHGILSERVKRRLVICELRGTEEAPGACIRSQIAQKSIETRKRDIAAGA